MMVSTSVPCFLIILALILLGILVKPWNSSDYIWALLGAVLLVALGYVPLVEAGWALMQSLDVIAFLIGMMLLSELAADVGIFTWLADSAVVWSRGSAVALFAIVYGCGIVTTMLLSNDATAVVLTPAVALMARRAKVDPVPLVLACAFVANAASFLLPVANPANLVLYHAHPPLLSVWLETFFSSALVCTFVTGLLLFFTQRHRLRAHVEIPHDRTHPNAQMRIVLTGILCIAAALLVASQAGYALGAMTFLLATVLVALLAYGGHTRIEKCFSGVSWGVLTLVAALFVVTAAVDHMGVTDAVRRLLVMQTSLSKPLASASFAGGITLFSMFVNNLPVGLLTSHVFLHDTTVLLGMPAGYGQRVALIAIDAGPNLAVTSSLATLLWLQVLKKHAIEYSSWAFLRQGMIIVPISLWAALTVLH